MAMTRTRRGGMAAAINATPMIDVLLVLLIIFMVMQQGLQRGLSVQVPPPRSDAVVEREETIVLEVLPGARYALNTRPVAAAALEETLRGVYANRPRKVIFVKGDGGLSYGDVTRAVDASRAAGVAVVGLVPRSPVP